MLLLINFLTVFLFFLKIELMRQELLDLKFVINITDIICGATSKIKTFMRKLLESATSDTEEE